MSSNMEVVSPHIFRGFIKNLIGEIVQARYLDLEARHDSDEEEIEEEDMQGLFLCLLLYLNRLLMCE